MTLLFIRTVSMNSDGMNLVFDSSAMLDITSSINSLYFLTDFIDESETSIMVAPSIRIISINVAGLNTLSFNALISSVV